MLGPLFETPMERRSTFISITSGLELRASLLAFDFSPTTLFNIPACEKWEEIQSVFGHCSYGINMSKIHYRFRIRLTRRSASLPPVMSISLRAGRPFG